MHDAKAHLPQRRAIRSITLSLRARLWQVFPDRLWADSRWRSTEVRHADSALRSDFDAARVRSAAKRSKDGAQARRLLALAAIYEGATHTEAAKIGGVTM